MFRWLRRREGKRIVAEVGEPLENRPLSRPIRSPSSIRILGEDHPAVSVQVTSGKT